ncbi:MAG: heavy metal translocating P-type ATPase [Methylocystaceae bacterium]
MPELEVNDLSLSSLTRIFWGKYSLETMIGLSGIFLVLSLIPQIKQNLGFDPAIIAALVGGYPIITGAIKAIIDNRDITAGLLVSIALIAALLIGEYFAAGEVAFIMLIGELLENRTAAKAWGALKDLVTLVPDTATLLVGHSEKAVPISEIKTGDIILVKAGQRVPVDGIVVRGQAAVNQAPITGEPMAVTKQIGDQVFVGSLNEVGFIEVRATNVGEDTTLSRLIEMVKNAQISKAPVQRLADRWATWLVPTSIGLALLTFLITHDVVRAVTILIVFCPCALVIATPTAIVAGIGNAAKRGILIKDGQVLESAGQVDTVVFDKTGTITKGTPQVASITSFGKLSNDDILYYAAICETRSEHQLAKAILKRYNGDLDNVQFDDYQVFPGQGVLAVIKGKALLLGNRALLSERSIVIPSSMDNNIVALENKGETAVFLAIDNIVQGVIGIEDEIKPEAVTIINELSQIGVKQVAMLTGDNLATAKLIAQKVSINTVFAEQMPEDKYESINKLKASGARVAMVGDGINDAPALAIADVGIAVGVTGTDLAVAASGMTLMSADIGKVKEALSISHKVMITVKQNLWAAATINLVAVVMASLGLLGPVAGAIVHNVGSVIVVGNAARLIRGK